MVLGASIRARHFFQNAHLRSTIPVDELVRARCLLEFQIIFPAEAALRHSLRALFLFITLFFVLPACIAPSGRAALAFRASYSAAYSSSITRVILFDVSLPSLVSKT